MEELKYLVEAVERLAATGAHVGMWWIIIHYAVGFLKPVVLVGMLCGTGAWLLNKVVQACSAHTSTQQGMAQIARILSMRAECCSTPLYDSHCKAIVAEAAKVVAIAQKVLDDQYKKIRD